MARLKKLRFDGPYLRDVLICYIFQINRHSGFLFHNLNLSDIFVIRVLRNKALFNVLLVIDSFLTESLFRTLKKLPHHRHFLPLCNDGTCWLLEIVIFLADIDVGKGLNDLEILRPLKNIVIPRVHSFKLRIIWVSLKIERQLMRLLANNRFVDFISVDLTCR